MSLEPRALDDLSGREEESRVAVVVRLRPPDSADEDINEVFSADTDRVTIRDPLSRGRSEHSYNFNRVFLPDSGQQLVFECVARPLIDRILEGFNSCCFAYGQTGSGKTHSIFGEGNSDQRGVLARSIEYLFERIENRAGHKEVGMVVSFTEIYLDQVRDLGGFSRQRRKSLGEESTASALGKSALRSSRPPSAAGASKDSSDLYLTQDLKIHETAEGLVYVEDLTLIPVSNIQEVLDVVNMGVRMRATYETRLNARSSRSHTIFTVSIVQKSRQSEDDVVGSMINFVDLAGSERLARSQSEGRRFQEAIVINSSLSALGKVVLALASDPKGLRHVPYRDSKLTRILQNSLGGNSYTTLLTTIDPSAVNYEESLNSLAFADRCKNVQNRPVLNHVDTQQETQEKTVHRLLHEVAALKHQLEVITVFKDMSKRLVVKDADSRDTTQLKARDGMQIADAGTVRKNTAMSESQVHAGGLRDDDTHSASDFAGVDTEDHSNLVETAKLRLRAERAQTLAAERKADAALANLERVQQELQLRDQQRRREAQEIRQKHRDIEIEIGKCRSNMAHIASGVSAQHAGELKMLQDNTSEVVRNKEDAIRQMPTLLAPNRNEGTDSLERQWARKTAQNTERLGLEARAVQEGHERECSSLEQQQCQWLHQTDMECQRITAELERCRIRYQRAHRHLRGELVDTHELVNQLASVVDVLEAGAPSQLRSGIRPPSLQLSALSSRMRSEGGLPDKVFEQLAQGTADIWRRVTKYENTLHQATKERGSENAADEWDADSFAYDFCDFRDGASVASNTCGDVGACGSLQRLNAKQLRSLCLALRRRVRFSPEECQAERERLREIVQKDLGGHSRVEQIFKLEQEIAEYKMKMSFEEHNSRQLEVALQSCARAASRSASRGASRTASRTGSRPPSRPASAGLYRPASAGLHRPRPASVGPARR